MPTFFGSCIVDFCLIKVGFLCFNNAMKSPTLCIPTHFTEPKIIRK